MKMLINSCLCHYDRIKNLYSFHASHKYNLFVSQMDNDNLFLSQVHFFQILSDTQSQST